MGGNALQYVKTVRKTAADYYPLMEDVLDQIANLFPMARCTIIKNYRSKPDFGDGDILLVTDGLMDDWMRQVQIQFNPREFVINRLDGTPLTYVRPDIDTGNPDLNGQSVVPDMSPPCMTVSFDYQDFQIDIMSVPEQYFESARDYYSYNDLGNLIGRIANRAGFKFGWQGLVKKIRDGSNTIGTIEITNNYSQMLEMFGYDPKRWKEGFETREDMFEYAASTPYFHRDLFKLENLNHENRARNKKRVNFMGFGEWLEDKPHLDKYPWVLAHPHDINPERDAQELKWQKMVEDKMYRNLSMIIDGIWETHRHKQEAKARFNGIEISKISSYHTVQLGQFMEYLRRSWARKPFAGGTYFEKWVNTVGPNEFRGWVLDELENFDNLSSQEQALYTTKRVPEPEPVSDSVRELYNIAMANYRRDGINRKE